MSIHARVFAFHALLILIAPFAVAHPGSGIFVDREGRVYFVDTGHGVWMIDRSGRVSEFHRNSFHWMAMDEEGLFANVKLSIRTPTSELLRITPDGARPAFINSSDFPVTVGSDGRLYHPSLDQPLKMLARSPDGKLATIATIPSNAGGSPLLWLNGLASVPDGNLYFTEDNAVRRVTPAGTVTTLVHPVKIDGCSRDPIPDSPGGPMLRGLAAAADGSIYVAATGCRAVVRISGAGQVKTLLTAEAPWAPTAVAVGREGVYVLEYLHTAGDDRREWVPRIRKISHNGEVSILAEIRRNGAERLRR